MICMPHHVLFGCLYHTEYNGWGMSLMGEKTVCESMDWINLTQDKDQWQAAVNMGRTVTSHKMEETLD